MTNKEVVTEIGEFDDDRESYYKIVDGRTISIRESELHDLWMVWVSLKGSERVYKDGLIRYIFPNLNKSEQ